MKYLHLFMPEFEHELDSGGGGVNNFGSQRIKKTS